MLTGFKGYQVIAAGEAYGCSYKLGSCHALLFDVCYKSPDFLEIPTPPTENATWYEEKFEVIRS